MCGHERRAASGERTSTEATSVVKGTLLAKGGISLGGFARTLNLAKFYGTQIPYFRRID